MAEEILTRRRLNRALLARQLLLERSDLSVPEAVEQVAGLQTQYAPSAYVGLWTRLAGFERGELTRALEQRTVVQATLMRGTIHVVSRREFWLFAIGVRRARREWWLRLTRTVTDDRMKRRADRLRTALAGGPRTAKDLGDLLGGQVGLWLDLVRVPPSGTWERRRADLYGLAESWIGPSDVGEEEGLEHVVRSYLRGFGPASLKDVSSWSGVPVTPLKEAAARLELRRFRDEERRELIDLPDAPLPDGGAGAPVRLLPHWDASLLVHARRTLVLPEEHRQKVFPVRNPFSVGTILVGGSVAGAWSLREGRIVLERYERVPRAAWSEVEAEAERLRELQA